MTGENERQQCSLERKHSLLKISWEHRDGNWYASLRLASGEGFDSIPIDRGSTISLEIKSERRCTGYTPKKGVRLPCDSFKQISSGDQCGECRAKDIYSDYVSGNGSVKTENSSKYSVYLVQIGDKTKVGVTRSGRIQNRWIEQGAQRACEIRRGLEAEKALKTESELSNLENISETIRKSEKVYDCDQKKFRRSLNKVLNRLDINEEPEVRRPCENLPYCDLKTDNLARKGRFPEPINAVRGQIIGNNTNNLAITSGRVVTKPSQKTFNDY